MQFLYLLIPSCQSIICSLLLYDFLSSQYSLHLYICSIFFIFIQGFLLLTFPLSKPVYFFLFLDFFYSVKLNLTPWVSCLKSITQWQTNTFYYYLIITNPNDVIRQKLYIYRYIQMTLAEIDCNLCSFQNRNRNLLLQIVLLRFSMEAHTSPWESKTNHTKQLL